MSNAQSTIRNLRGAVAAALIIAEDNPTMMVFVDNVQNDPTRWVPIRGGDPGPSAFLIEAGVDFEETVALIKWERGI